MSGRTEKKQKPLADALAGVEGFDVLREEMIFDRCELTSSGWSAVCRVRTVVDIDGVVYAGDHFVRIPLTEGAPTDED